MPSSPAFQFYPSDFLADENQMLMELAEVGAYIRLICVCWKEGSIPTDMRKLAKLVGTAPKEMERVWPAVAPCFDPHPVIADRLVHPRLERERRKQAAHKQKMSEAGRRGADARKAKKDATDEQPDPSQAEARLQLGLSSDQAFQSLPSGESSASAESSITEQPQRAAFVENPVPEYLRTEYTRYQLVQAAGRECGMGTWTNAEEHAASSIVQSWFRQGRTSGQIWAAVHGSRLMVDAGKVDWVDGYGRPSMPPKRPFHLRALVNTTTLFEQGDGKAPRPFFDVAMEEYQKADDRPRARGPTGNLHPIADVLRAVANGAPQPIKPGDSRT